MFTERPTTGKNLQVIALSRALMPKLPSDLSENDRDPIGALHNIYQSNFVFAGTLLKPILVPLSPSPPFVVPHPVPSPRCHVFDGHAITRNPPIGRDRRFRLIGGLLRFVLCGLLGAGFPVGRHLCPRVQPSPSGTPGPGDMWYQGGCFSPLSHASPDWGVWGVK